MSLNEILEHRRAIRHFDENKPLDSEIVKECLRIATLELCLDKRQHEQHKKL